MKKESPKFKKQGKKYVCKQSQVNIEANKELLKKGIVFEDETHKIEIIPIEEMGKETLEVKEKEGVIRYERYNGIDDIEYEVMSNKLKESIIINQKRDKYKYEFIMRIKGLEYDEGSHEFRDENSKETIYKLTEYIMYDGLDKESKEIAVNIERLDKKEFKLIVEPSSKWINQETTMLPIVIDPSIEVVNKEVIEIASEDSEQNYLAKIDGMIKVGYVNESNQAVELIFNISKLIAEINEKGLTRYKALVSLKIKEGESTSNCGIYTILEDSTIVYEEKLSNKEEVKIDITYYVQEAIANNKTTFFLTMSNSSIEHLTSSQYEDMGGTIKNDYIYIYNQYNNDDNLKPKLRLEYFNPENRANSESIASYENGKGGTSSINLYDGSMIHEVNVASIKENSLELNVNHVFNRKLYNETSIDKEEKFLGKGWKSNFHQYLIKDETFNTLLGTKDITYIDGQGYSHELREKWYYEEGDSKTYVGKDEVFLDDDGLIKVSVNGELKEVKYEVNSEEGLTYVSASSMYEYQPKKFKRYYVDFKNERRAIDIYEEEHNLNYYYIENSKKIYVKISDITKNQDFTLTVNGNKVYIDTSTPLMLQTGTLNDYFFTGTYTEISEEEGETTYNDLTYRINVSQEIIEEEEENLDIYKNEEIKKIETNIEEAKRSIQDLENNKESLLRTTNTLIDNYISVVKQRGLNEEIISCKNFIQECQKEFKNQQLEFYYQDVDNFTQKGEEFINESIDRRWYSNASGNTVAVDNTSVFSCVIEFARLNGEELYMGKPVIKATSDYIYKWTGNTASITMANNILDAWNKMYQLASLNMESTSLYLEKNEKYSDSSDELQKEQYKANEKNLREQINDYETQYINLVYKLDEYKFLLNRLEKQKETLIKEQRKKANDFVIDKEGNTLGFNGYGQLISIQDRNENEVKINYDKENKKIETLTTKSQTIKFEYNNDLLSKIIDNQGRVTTLVYEDNILTDIDTINEGIMIKTSENEFCVTDELSNKLCVQFYENKVNNIYKTYNSGTKISEDGILEAATEIESINDKIAYSANMTQVTNIKNETIKIIFDAQGNIVNIIKDEEINVRRIKEDKLMIDVIFDNSKDKLVDIDALGLSKTISKEIVVGTDVTQEKINKYMLLGVKLDLGYFGVNSTANIQRVKLSAKVISNSRNELFEEEYQEIENQIIVLPLILFSKDITSIELNIEFSEEVDTTKINDISLIGLEGKVYKYDNEEHLISINTGLTTTQYSTFVNGKATNVIHKDRFNRTTVTKYLYDNEGRITYQEDSYKNAQEYYYDEKGNLIEQRVYNKNEPTMATINKYSYDEYGNMTRVDGIIKDGEGLTHNTNIEYVPGTSLIKKVISPRNIIISYGYDKKTNELLSISSDAQGQNNSTQFSYQKGLLTTIRHHGEAIQYTYDPLGRVIAMNVCGNKDYVTYTYEDNITYGDLSLENASIITTTYKNGYTTKTIYDKEGKVVRVIDGSQTIDYKYDEDKKLITKGENQYFYENDKLKSYNNSKFDKTLIYDNYGRLSQTIEETILGNTYTIYSYYDDDSVQSVDIDNNLITNKYEYDCLKRNTKHLLFLKGNELLTNEYSYLQVEDNTLDLIKEHNVKVNNKLIDIFTYEYDLNGNIVSIESDDEGKTRYQYDTLNRIVREDNHALNKTIKYKYDKGGNLLYKKEYEYTLEKEPKSIIKKDMCTYSNEEWKDQISYFNQEGFEYDEMGRPILYKDKKMVWTEKGDLQEYHYDLNDYMIYEYNEEGIRTLKTNEKGTIKTYYHLDGTKVLTMEGYVVVEEKQENFEIICRYSLDKIIGLNYNGNEYIYQRNIQGDITHILDINGNVVAKYIYDAWGNHKVLNSDGSENTDLTSIGHINPFRYRGYLYDSETQLYWVSSRYYSPELCRWISPDSIEYLDPESINGLNLYCYCMNNPIMYADPSGHFAITSFLIGLGISALIGAVAGGVSYAASELVSYAFTGEFSWSWASFAGSVLGGAIGGALAAIPGVNAMLVAGVSGFASTAIGMGLENAWEGKDYTFGQIMFVSTINGLISSAAGGLFEAIPIKGLTSGRGSYSAITKQITTKFFNGTIKRITYNTFSKMLTYNMLGGMIGAGVSGVMDATGANDWTANWFHQRTGF